MSSEERAQRTSAADALCAKVLEAALDGAPDTGLALVAVGGYGRGELAPYSDLDIVLVHDDARDVGELGQTLWYPLWDSGVAIDHSVRALSEVTTTAENDVRVALGLLDARHVAGDPHVTLQLRTDILAHWRRDARRNIPEVRELVDARAARMGELAHAAIPDLKESLGGLRDATALNHLVATWLVDVPHVELERSRISLLDVRDRLHEVNGRAGDRIAPDAWPALAEALGITSTTEAQKFVRLLGRRITHISRLTWSRADAVLQRPSGASRRRPEMNHVAPGVAVSRGEVVLERKADPAQDPLLLLRAAAEASERGLVLAPATVARLVKVGAPLPDPWPAEARTLFSRLLAAGEGLLEVWETLDETGALELCLPEWESVRLLPHASIVHRYTVDRHMVETCIEASRLIRRVSRPDILLVAALLHDIGKGTEVDHSIEGEPIAESIARRMGFSPDEVATIRALVRWHLLLSEVSTSRDLEDPATIDYVAERIPGREVLDLLEVLTEADARATGPKAWSSWRAALVRDLAAAVRARFESGTQAPQPASAVELKIPRPVRKGKVLIDVSAEPVDGGLRLRVIGVDRVGLMAAISGALGLVHASIRAARAWSQDEYGVSEWDIDDVHLDPGLFSQQVESMLTGELDPGPRLRKTALTGREPSVTVQLDASSHATVIEVRMDDRPGVVHLVCAALAAEGRSVRSAHVATHGPQALDVFYVQDSDGQPLSSEAGEAAGDAVRRALTGRD